MIPAFKRDQQNRDYNSQIPMDVCTHAMTEKYEAAILDMAKNMEDPTRCPIGSLKTVDGKIHPFKIMDATELSETFFKLSIKGSVLTNFFNGGVISAIVCTAIAIILLVGVFTLFIPFYVPLIFVGMALLTIGFTIYDYTKAKAMRDEFGKAHVLFYQQLAHDLIHNPDQKSYVNVENVDLIKETLANELDIQDTLENLKNEIFTWKEEVKRGKYIMLNSDQDFVDKMKQIAEEFENPIQDISKLNYWHFLEILKLLKNMASDKGNQDFSDKANKIIAESTNSSLKLAHAVKDVSLEIPFGSPLRVIRERLMERLELAHPT